MSLECKARFYFWGEAYLKTRQAELRGLIDNSGLELNWS